MNLPTDLPFRATLDEACAWLFDQTGTPWTLAHLIEHAVTPYVWLDYDSAYPDLFGDANGGYAAPIFFEGDTARLAQGSEDVLITITKDAHKIVTRLPEPGFTRALHELRFQKKDLQRLVESLKRAAEPKVAPAPQESRLGINREQVLAAFSSLVKFDMASALDGGEAIFGDDGARVKGSARKSKKTAMFNPVTLAFGLNDLYRVPLPRLTRVFRSHDFLDGWAGQWDESLALLGR